MCRMWLANNLPFNQEQLQVWAYALNLDQGTGGAGYSWYENGELRAVKSASFTQGNMSLVAGLISEVNQFAEGPFIFHIRGPLQSSNYNHPHTSQVGAYWTALGNLMSATLEDALVHNGDTASGDMGVLIKELQKRFPELYWRDYIDTQLMAFIIGQIGPQNMAELVPNNGSFIYTKGGEYWIKRGTCSRHVDYTKLYVAKWGEDSWAIASNFLVSQVAEAKVYQLPMGFYTLEQALNLQVPQLPPHMKRRSFIEG